MLAQEQLETELREIHQEEKSLLNRTIPASSHLAPSALLAHIFLGPICLTNLYLLKFRFLVGDHSSAQGDLYMTDMDNLETLPFDSESACAALPVPEVGTMDKIP